MSILNYFVGEVLPDVNVLGLFPTPDDVAAPFDARGVVVVDRCRRQVGACWAKSILSRRLRKYKTSVAAVEDYPAYSVERAVVFCIFERQRTGELFYKHRLPYVERRDELFPHWQSESVNPDQPSSTPERRRYVSSKLKKPSRHSIRWCKTGLWDGPAGAQNSVNVDTEKDVSHLIHGAANCSLATRDR